MKDLIIVADGSFGLDVRKIILAVNENRKNKGQECPYRIKGFLAAGEAADIRNLQPLLGTVEDRQPEQDEYYVMGILNPKKKEQAVRTLKDRGARFETIRAPWVMAHLDMQFPEGCVIAAQSIMDSARIGKFVTLFHSMVGFDAFVGDYASVMAYVNITTAHIGERAFIGDNSVVIRKTVNDDAVVMPGSVVVKDVKAGTTVMGNPARRVKE